MVYSLVILKEEAKLHRIISKCPKKPVLMTPAFQLLDGGGWGSDVKFENLKPHFLQEWGFLFQVNNLLKKEEKL